MEHKRVIQHCLAYIEAHIKTEITATELAAAAGYSLYHFYRLFYALTGFPVMQYILRRRLLHAVYSIQCGNTGIQASLEYGFETYAGYTNPCVRLLRRKRNGERTSARVRTRPAAYGSARNRAPGA